MIAPEDRHKTAFRFNGKLYEYNRVPFGLSSAPGTFNMLISKILLGLDKFCAGFFDDILIFSQNVTDDVDHVKQVLSAIFTAGLKLNCDKYIFLVDTVEFLGYTISLNKVTVSESKIKTIKDYPVPKYIKKFLGLAGFYRKLLPNFSELVAPLSVMQCKNVTFYWNSDCQKSFDKIISLLCSSTIVAKSILHLGGIVE